MARTEKQVRALGSALPFIMSKKQQQRLAAGRLEGAPGDYFVAPDKEREMAACRRRIEDIRLAKECGCALEDLI